MLKKKLLVALLVAAALVVLGVCSPAGAVKSVGGDQVTLPGGEINGPLFAAGNGVVVDADVDGDVFIAGQSVTINGTVRGDLLGAAQTVRVNGKVTGDARCAANEIQLYGEIGQSLSAFGAVVRLAEGARVGRDVLVFAGDGSLAGAVGRQVLGSGGTLRLNGPVGGDVHLWGVDALALGPAAAVGGNLTYSSPKEARIAPGARVSGTTDWERLERKEKYQHPKGINWVAQFIWFAAGIAVWGLITLMFPRLWPHLGEIVGRSTWVALGLGLLLLLVTPPAIVLLLITVVGIPVSLILLAVYLALLYAAKIIAADALSRFLMRRLAWENRVHAILPFAAVFAGLVLLTKIPVIGILVNLTAACLAIGTVALAFYRWRQRVPISDPAS